MRSNSTLKNAIIFALVFFLIAAVIGYFIFARNRVNNELIPLKDVLGIEQDFFKNFGNRLRRDYLSKIRLNILYFGLGGAALGFIIGAIRYK